MVLENREREVKFRSFAGFGFNPNIPAVLVDDFLAKRKPDARAGVIAAAMEAVENFEDLIGVLGVNADAVVNDREQPLV